MDFEHYQHEADRTRTTEDDEVFSLGLIGEMGSIASVVKRARRGKLDAGKVAAYRSELVEELGDALWYLTAIATTYDIKMEQVAVANLTKIRNYFGTQAAITFDDAAPLESRLPTTMDIVMRVRDDGRVVITVNDLPTGDALDSSSPIEDNYKYHDVVHFAFAAKLGWSPVLRDLLQPKRKRKDAGGKNIPDDGARARIVEEAISAILFAQAPKLNWFATPEDVPLRTLELIKRVTAEYEVKVRTVPDWQAAICSAFRLFKSVEEKNEARIRVNLPNREIVLVSTA